MSVTASEIDVKWMTRALAEARKGTPSPNPHVGAVIVKDDQLISVGFHERAGHVHAEVAALEAAGEAARGATLYVTLEPCNHVGRTGPCTAAVVAAGIVRVVVAMRDPNPHVDGGGLEALRAQGVQVVSGVLEAEAKRMVLPWSKYITTGLPFVSLKLGLSLDGRIAARSGVSKWITGKLARAKVHALRAKHDAIAVGIGTALADDPLLTVRDAPGRDPIRVVFDSRLRLPLSSKLVTSINEAPLVVMTSESADEDSERALTSRGAIVLRAESSAEGRVNLVSALTLLAEQNIVSLMVEGGAELAGSFLATRLAQHMHAFVAPLLLGPRGRPGAVDWAGPASPQEAPRIRDAKWELCNEDAYVHGEIDYADEVDE